MDTTSQDTSKKILTASINSWMQFMREENIHDSYVDSYVRFRGEMIVPNWDGVEDNEFDYVVDNPNERLDTLANIFYNDVSRWWVIAMRNKLDLPDIQIHSGLKLKIPNKDWVDSVLTPQGRVLVTGGV